ncbi:hypothetical protein [Aureliella helgolandensis]|uniref:Uncharacterized protein n=1 Tax=Aureliella helgolandensis TaxID=2527968 RepID=A0A518G962_9BACT|nr:hypothetical protein [Aureliella helgolandensis]QDV25138.1 hypothetical protein Q31a_34610 [Aureliella helgolandensis]
MESLNVPQRWTSPLTRRQMLQTSLAGASLASPLATRTLQPFASAQERGERPNNVTHIKVLNPRQRVPVSFIIDDSTCLVNLAHFGIPHFAEAYPDRYPQDWRKLPREIPDSFVRIFADWCRDHGVKGKYSIVPYPACVGWMDRDLPGWSKAELADSLKLVREELTPNWDIHPEMITHTWAINTKTGRPFPQRTEQFMENFGWSQDKSADELTDYLSYALRILKNAGLPCQGLTTPGGFGSRNRINLAQASLESCRDVFQTEIPHYFRDLYGSGDESVAPRVELASGLNSEHPECVVSIVGCTGDWFGGWDGLEIGQVDQFITEDLQGGRLPEILDREEPTILVCHWPGIYANGTQAGFKIFQEAVQRIHARNDNLLWMKLSEIARYWAAKELTSISQTENRIEFNAPFASPDFTVELPLSAVQSIVQKTPAGQETLRKIDSPLALKSGTWLQQRERVVACFELPQGQSHLHLNG